MGVYICMSFNISCVIWMIQKKHLTLNGKEFDMLPKKIYLNYVNEDDVDKTWSEEPVSASDCEMNNREYTDLSQVWHDPSEEPVPGTMILVLFMSGIFTSWRSISYITDVFRKLRVLKWAYVDDLTIKDSI